MTRQIPLDELAALEGTDFGPTAWLSVDQATIDAFADATGDHQWIHVDPERAKDGPFGGTIAHGLLTLSLLPWFLHELFEVTGPRMAINYGFDKVRFPTAVPSGARLRATGQLARVSELESALQSVVTVAMEVEGQDKPACVAESVVRYVR
ncbi:MaoC family dehydratase [Nitriliruptor alkaliphilus]|uniref:MaoC family dehydratase n=1 Tax=Nitriliruptor alkaliphilus TaxID=427918 RepID=UPI000697AC5D|nr:MaoC family dehydratase [Nitriliruptor alkaliphilus]